MRHLFFLICVTTLWIEGVFQNVPTTALPPPIVVPSDHTGTRVSECKVASTLGYGYRRLFHWGTSLEEKKANGMSGAPFSATLHFRVRAFSDAHIMLSPSPNPAEGDPVYEIVLGAGRNSFSDIRRLRRSGTKTTMSTPDIVSPYMMRGFWIRLSTDGTIEVGREGDDTAFMGWRDPQPLLIRYFAFCTWTGTVGKWEYDCPNNNTEHDEVQEVEQTGLTWIQQLRRDLLTQYDPYVRPKVDDTTATTVYLHLACQHINLDDKKEVITVFGTMSMHWMDEKLTWNIDNYGGLKTLHAAAHEVWLPELILYNSADGSGDSVFNSENAHITVGSDGAVMWSPQAKFEALCALNMAAWPQDRHTCALHLGVWSHASTVTLKLMENGTAFDDQYTKSQWQVEEVTARHLLEPEPWLLPTITDDYDIYSEIDNAPYDSVFSLEVTVKRRSSVYHIVLLTPVLAMTLSMFASFYISPLHWSRLTLCCLNLLLIFIFTAGVGSDLPYTSDSVPQIISVLSGGYIVATVALLATVLAIRLARCERQNPPPRFIMRQLDGFLGIVLVLPPPPQIMNSGNKAYDHLQESKSVLRESNDINLIFNNPAFQIQWLRLSTAIDRVLSFIYCISLAILVM